MVGLNSGWIYVWLVIRFRFCGRGIVNDSDLRSETEMSCYGFWGGVVSNKCSYRRVGVRVLCAL